jgi:hypothetical protein
MRLEQCFIFSVILFFVTLILIFNLLWYAFVACRKHRGTGTQRQHGDYFLLCETQSARSPVYWLS